jgi:hypothetical protein
MTANVSGDRLRTRRVRELIQRRAQYEQMRAVTAERCCEDAALYQLWASEPGEDADTVADWSRWAEEKSLEALDPLPHQREALERAEQDLRARWEDREVLVRPYGGARRYHIGPACGLVNGGGRHPERFESLLEGEAKARGLRPCSVGACTALRRQVVPAGVLSS